MFKKIFLGLILLMGFLMNGCVLNSSKVNTFEIKWDADRDGITNDKDKCPGTEEDMEVNEEGCP